MTLPPIYTLAEAAERLRMSKNALARIARRTGHCAETGRNLLFSETDLDAIWEAIRVAPGASVQGSVLGISEAELHKRAQAFLAGPPKRRL